MKLIPAMTTDAERAFYYEIAKEAAGRGEIVELGAWLGASTAWIAAGIRDSGFARKARVYDKFVSKPGHRRKVEAFFQRNGLDGIPEGSCLDQFRENLGPLGEYVEVHRGQIEQMVWSGGPIAALITDAPKRVPAISAVLTTLRHALVPGTIMAWQDFCHFPSYEIAACLYRLRDHIEFVAGVVPGTTLAFRVTSQWTAEEVSLGALSLYNWDDIEVGEAWAYWINGRVPEEKIPLFLCGRSMFLCDIGEADLGAKLLLGLRQNHRDAIEAKWDYLRETRPDFVKRYAPLFDVMARETC